MNCGHLPMDTRLLLLLLFLFLLTFSPAAADLAGDGASLMTFRAAVGRFVLPWNTSVSPCMWPGVTCASNRVVSLRLPGSGLIGQIPEGTLGNLSNLQTLSLRFNALSGPLPSDLARCKELRNLYLQGNRFSGEIPAFLSSLSSLVRLNLAENNFSGVIPLAFNNLTRLGTLYLESLIVTVIPPALVISISHRPRDFVLPSTTRSARRAWKSSGGMFDLEPDKPLSSESCLSSTCELHMQDSSSLLSSSSQLMNCTPTLSP
ncbi:probable inactive receptor kinase RLK902 [Dendrobium catenatum]|uniref:probable inactive receptor kinase RLK902 n=1 Tax=Dendrobium catenatum TaxID=906689 RepID=UPI0010A04159|nr:probable inactive receptor kinase RLK902 [Dendrobium catenatum]